MKQKVLFVEDIIDPEIKREILRRVVMDLHIHDEKWIECLKDVLRSVGVIKGRKLLTGVARRHCIGPTVIRPISNSERRSPLRDVRNLLADRRRAADRAD